MSKKHHQNINELQKTYIFAHHLFRYCAYLEVLFFQFIQLFPVNIDIIIAIVPRNIVVYHHSGCQTLICPLKIVPSFNVGYVDLIVTR